MKVSFHFGRNGCANHNDRNFDYLNDPHIDNDRVKDNVYIRMEEGMTFKEAELNFYKENFTQALQAQNKRNTLARKATRNKTIKEIYSSPRTRPQELIFQIGNHNDKFEDAAAFEAVTREYIDQFNERYGNNCQVLDVAIHREEDNIHAHMRFVWFIETEEGRRVSQDKALAECGIEPPFPDEPTNKRNNRQITFTALERRNFMNICKEYGIEIEPTNHNSREKHLPILEKREQLIMEHIEKLTDKINELEQTELDIKRIVSITKEKDAGEVLDIFEHTTSYKKENEDLKKQLLEKEKELEELRDQLVRLNASREQMRQTLHDYEELIRYNKKLKKALDEAIAERERNQ